MSDGGETRHKDAPRSTATQVQIVVYAVETTEKLMSCRGTGKGLLMGWECTPEEVGVFWEMTRQATSVCGGRGQRWVLSMVVGEGQGLILDSSWEKSLEASMCSKQNKTW